MTKTCICCKEEKPINEYYPRHRMGNSYASNCKKCSAIIRKEWRRNNPGSVMMHTRKQREANPNRLLAYSRINHAKEYGIIRPPDACEICQEKTALSGHHEDYSKSLLVIWVCRQCHSDIHNQSN